MVRDVFDLGFVLAASGGGAGGALSFLFDFLCDLKEVLSCEKSGIENSSIFPLLIGGLLFRKRDPSAFDEFPERSEFPESCDPGVQSCASSDTPLTGVPNAPRERSLPRVDMGVSISVSSEPTEAFDSFRKGENRSSLLCLVCSLVLSLLVSESFFFILKGLGVACPSPAVPGVIGGLGELERDLNESIESMLALLDPIDILRLVPL